MVESIDPTARLKSLIDALRTGWTNLQIMGRALRPEELQRSDRIDIDVAHTYVGDLVVRVQPPAGTGSSAITLHDRTGGGADDLKKTYDPVNTPGLNALVGANPSGKWTLSVRDNARQDAGAIRSFSVTLSY